MKLKFIVTGLFFTFSSAYAEVDISEIELQGIGYEVIYKPKSLSWTELYHDMYKVKSLLKSDIDFNIGECLDVNQDKLVLIDSYYQNILYKDYEWSSYVNPVGKKCIKLTKPNFGFLSQNQAVIFMNASKGIGFEQLGYWKDAEEYALKINNYKNNCHKKLKKLILAQDGEKFNEYDYLYDNKLIDKPTCSDAVDKTKEKNKVDTKSVFGVDDRVLIDNSNSLGEAFSHLAYLKRGSGGLGACRLRGSGFYINPYTIVTAAHVIKYRGCKNISFNVKAYVSPKLRENYNAKPKNNSSYNSIWKMNNRDGDSIDDFINDYGALKQSEGHFIPLYGPISISPLFPIIENPQTDDMDAFGYPEEVRGQNYYGELFGETSVWSFPDPLINYVDSNSRRMISHRMDQTPGQSGGPLYFRDGWNEPGSVIRGILSLGYTVSGNTYNYAVAIDNYSGPDLLSWAAEPPPNIAIDFISPTYLEQILWEDINDNTFSIILESYNFLSKDSEIEDNLVWESNVNGLISNGRYVSESDAKSVLRSGDHEITVSINTAQYYGEQTQFIKIVGPEGGFSVFETKCIVNLSISQSCQLAISWSTVSAPNAYVFNNRTQNIFSNSTQGNNVPITMIPGQDTELVLYADAEKLYDMDRVTLSAKLPTGNLSAPATQCSLQPSPTTPDGSPRDPKATPPGCGVELSWSNVQWASPSIFYKPVGSGSWQFLHQIPCALNGDICDGSIHTDDFVPELIPVSGYQFKLVQFNDANSGNLTAPFTITAKRFADVYEFDDGWFDLPDNQYNLNDERSLATGGTISNRVNIGQVQANHNFHRPAAYDPIIDIDSYDVSTSTFAISPATQVSIEISNMANGLDVDFEVQCVGERRLAANGEYINGVWDIPQNPIVSSDVVGNIRVMRFNSVKFRDYYDDKNRYIAGFICSYNRIKVFRTSGIPSDTLTYTFKATIPSQVNSPTLDSVGTISSNNYKIELIGDNFDTNASVSVREDFNGSQPLEVFPANLFHAQGVNSNNKDYIRFPIVKVNQQNKFNGNGLCFKVLNGTTVSNEKCFKRPTTNPQPAFMGELLQSYHHTNAAQDIDTDAYIVKANGALMKLWGNTWKKIPFNYTVTPNTEIQFDFGSTLNEGEISGIGFVMNGQTDVTGAKFWQLHGTQGWGNQEHHDYSGTAYKTYKIKIGQKFTGKISHIVFVADNDTRVGQNILFKPVVFKEVMTIDEYDDVPAQRAFDDDVNGRGALFIGSSVNNVVRNFHDSGDVDWTIIVGEDFKVSTNLLSTNSQTRLQLYKWIDAIHDSDLGYFTYVNDILVGESSDSWNEPIVNWSTEPNIAYAVKATSLNGNFGIGTEYNLVFEGMPIGTPDNYESGMSDDNESTPAFWINGTTEKNHNFHDNNDVDWTLAYTDKFTAYAQVLGEDADIKMTVYRWETAEYNNGVFTNIVSHYYDHDFSDGDSTVQVNYHEAATFAIKIESKNGAYGNGTSYKLKLY